MAGCNSPPKKTTTNLKITKALGLTVPSTLLASTDGVIK